MASSPGSISESESDVEQSETNPNLDGDYVLLHEIRKQRPSRKAKETGLASDGSTTASISPTPVSDLRNKLFEAAELNDVNATESVETEIMAISKQLTDQELRDQATHKTVLNYAIECGSNDVIAYFIQRGSDELITSFYTITVDNVQTTRSCLHQLVQQGNPELVQTFLTRLQANPDKSIFLKQTTLTEIEGEQSRDMAAIHIAACKDNPIFVKMLVQVGSSINSVNQKKDTPLMWSARLNNINTTKYILSQDADIDAQNDKGSSALYRAVRYGHWKTAKLLLEHGADPHIRRSLGFQTALVLASAYGRVEIVQLLLEFEADVNQTINGGDTALHVAAAEGNVEVIQVLIKAGAHINLNNDQGMTPLLNAAQNSHDLAVECLVKNGADINASNKMGQTAWHFAIDTEDMELLTLLMDLYRERTKIYKPRKINFEVLYSPLHCAAEKDNIKQLRKTTDLGVGSYSRDLNGNTFLHIAAQCGSINVIKDFVGEIDYNDKNNDGDTPIHIACKYGQLEVVKLLLTRCKLSVKNDAGETPLHVAVQSDKSSKLIVELVLDMMVKASSWSLLNEGDDRGNTALHVAAGCEKEELMPSLRQLSASKINNLNENPLHLAVRKGNVWLLRSMLKVFGDPRTGFDIDQKNGDGETLLHLCCKQGEWEAVELLLSWGSDLEIRDNTGNTPLHDLVQESVDSPHDITALVEVFKMIMKKAAIWWCRKHELTCPSDEDSDSFQTLKQNAILYLTEEIRNNSGLSVINLGSHIGAVAIMEELWNLEGVFRLTQKYKGKIEFDVTNMLIETRTEDEKEDKDSFSGEKHSTESQEDEIDKLHCTLDFIVNMDDELRAAQMLKVLPIRLLVEQYWHVYQWIYALVLLLHLIYISCLSVYAIDESEQFLRSSNSSYALKGTTMFLFLIWPSTGLIFELILLVLWCRHLCKSMHCLSLNETSSNGGTKPAESKENYRDPTKLIYAGFNLLLSQFPTIINVIFSFCTILWFILYTQRDELQVYCLSLALLFGWLRCISLAKAFQTVSSLIIALKYIVLRDMARFFFIYFFVMMAFAYGFHALLRIPPSLALQYAVPGSTIWTTLGVMIGFDDFGIDDEFDAKYADEQSSSTTFRVAYIIYLVLSNVVLLNILIGMLSSTYDNVVDREATTWTVQSTRMALRLEHAFECIPRIRKKLRGQSNINFDIDKRRWILVVNVNEIKENKEVDTDETSKSINRLRGKLVLVEETIEEIYEMVQEQDEKYNKLISIMDSVSKHLNIVQSPKATECKPYT